MRIVICMLKWKLNVPEEYTENLVEEKMCSHVFYNAKLNKKKEDYEFEEYVSNVGVGK